jgi:hypothetical protein
MHEEKIELEAEFLGVQCWRNYEGIGTMGCRTMGPLSAQEEKEFADAVS